MANDLRLQVVLGVIDKAIAPIKNITQGSAALTKKVAEAQTALRQLGQQEKTIGAFNKARDAMGQAGNKLAVLQAQLDGMQRSGTASAAAIAKHEKAIARQTREFDKQKVSVFDLRQRLNSLGVTSVTAAQNGMAAAVAKANRELDAQKAKLDRLNTLKAKHAKQMTHMGMLAAGGVGSIAAGRQIARPVGSIMAAYSEQEDARSGLSSAMMQADGSMPAEFQKLDKLAVSLGNRLPGTTADFYDMLTMLRRQGLSAQTILGGTGEAAAYLGVQLRMPVTEAAEFAAKMQDATRTTEADMMGLMDTIQRTYYLGVDPDNMLQGFTKLSPVLSIIRKEGLEAAKELAPFLVMFDQAGMKSEASGNAMRKVMQGAMNMDKVKKANKSLAPGQRLNFTDGKGEFGGRDQMMAELAKLKSLTTVQRLDTLKTIFGDDAETMQVISILIDKGMAGYREVEAKMKAQADLQQRVNKQLATLTNVKEAAEGAFTNVMADAGATVEEDLKKLIKWLDEMTEKLRKLVAENPELVKWLMRGAMGLAALSIGLGILAIGLASTIGPMLVVRFLLARFGLSIWGVVKGITWLAKLVGSWLFTALRLAGSAFMWAARGLLVFGRAGLAFVMTPLGATLAAVAAAAFAAYYVWKNWDKIGPMLIAAWATIKAAFSAGWTWIKTQASAFWNAGAELMNGLVNGITSRLAAVRDAVTGAASQAVGWFKEKLGIRSPSRIFMQLGGWVSEGAALGIQAKAPMVARAAAAMAALPALAAAPALATPVLTTPARISAPAPAAGGDAAATAAPIQITINAAPGMDPQAIARAVAAELDRRARDKQSRGLSKIGEI